MANKGLVVREEIKSAELFLDVLSPRNIRWEENPTNWIFRGQADSSWKLIPSAFRNTTNLSYSGEKLCAPRPTNKEQIICEYNIFESFREIIDRQGLMVPDDSQVFRTLKFTDWIPRLEKCKTGECEWPPMEYLSLMALAQHYGLPTRLLDWSHNSYVAAYFAVREAAEWQYMDERKDVTHISVWALMHTYLSAERNYSNGKFTVVTAPTAGNPNLHAQMGVFTLNGPEKLEPKSAVKVNTIDIEVEENLKQVGKDSKTFMTIMYEFKLPISESRKLLRLFAIERVNAASLFPGFSGAAKALLERRFMDK